MEKSPKESAVDKPEPADQKSDVESSVENGRKMIEIQNIIDKKSAEEEAEDAAKWRNEG